jgi:hypothetical protein
MAIRQARVIELQADSKYAPIPTNVLLLIEANKTCMTYLLEGVSDFYKHVSGEKSVCPKLEVDTISVFAHTRSQRYFEAEIMRDELMQCMATGRPSRCRTLVFKFDGPFMFGRNSEHDGCVDFTPLTLGKYLVLAWREGCEALSDFDVARVKDVIGATSRPLTLVGLPAKTLQAIMPHVEMREPLVTVVTHRKYSERVGTRAYNHQFNIGTRFGVRLS